MILKAGKHNVIYNLFTLLVQIDSGVIQVYFYLNYTNSN